MAERADCRVLRLSDYYVLVFKGKMEAKESLMLQTCSVEKFLRAGLGSP
jgi:hypothetical protein